VSSVYVETSAILSWLFGESTATAVTSAIDEAETVLTSVLTGVEVRRSLIRAEHTGILTPAAATHLLGVFETVSRAWIVVEITPEIRSRASARFPVEPIRSLDAIHLATALELLRAVDELEVLSLDRRIVDNLDPLGLRAAVAT
jgi:predicted nucleic acid-binding protein